VCERERERERESLSVLKELREEGSGEKGIR
jgi:hypothetical protein